MEELVRTILGKKQRSLVETGALIAQLAHAGQVRKDDGAPYIIHPTMVALKLARHGFDERVLAAAFVHDVLEDTAFVEADLKRFLGSEVVGIVREVTEDKQLVWEERKQRYIAQVARASMEAKAVSVADKIHNLESLLEAHARHGEAVWRVFNRGREQKCWFERTLCQELQKTWQHPLLDEYAVLVQRLERLG